MTQVQPILKDKFNDSSVFDSQLFPWLPSYEEELYKPDYFLCHPAFVKPKGTNRSKGDIVTGVPFRPSLVKAIFEGKKDSNLSSENKGNTSNVD